MGYYWAKFENHNENLYRFDTRIYLEKINEILENDECIGAIVGKNPGSAIPENSILGEFCKIELNNDKLLPTIRNIIIKSNPQTEGRKYIQVLNLFYLCNPDLSEAIKDYENRPNPKICNTENHKFPWIWFMWGGQNKKLTEKKIRFKNIQTEKQFYLNNKTKNVIEDFPEDKICAKHTQGMQHALVIPYLERIMK